MKGVANSNAIIEIELSRGEEKMGESMTEGEGEEGEEEENKF